MINLKTIDPKISGGKFSPNLHRWMKKERRHIEEMQAFDTLNSDYSHIYGRTVLGFRFDGDVIGAHLKTILVDGGRATTWSYSGSVDWPVIVGWWDRYVRLGRCALDPEHAMSFQQDHGPRYTETGDVRACNWCGARHVRERWTETKVYQRERWVEIGGAS